MGPNFSSSVTRKSFTQVTFLWTNYDYNTDFIIAFFDVFNPCMYVCDSPVQWTLRRACSPLHERAGSSITTPRTCVLTAVKQMRRLWPNGGCSFALYRLWAPLWSPCGWPRQWRST